MIDGGLDAIATLARETASPMTPLQRMRGLEVVLRRGEARQRGRRTILVASALSACGLVAAGVIGVFVARGHTTSPGKPGQAAQGAPIAYRVENGEIGDGGYLRASDREPDGDGVSLHFAEGTLLRLAAGARGRLTSVDAIGARFAIEQGEAQISVVPRAGARWLIDAGPFLIAVHGTVFSAAWDGATEQLDIEMKRGLVSVTGPVADGMIAVHAGQRLTINVQQREVLLRPSQDAEGAGGNDSDNDATRASPGAQAAPPTAPGEAPRAVVAARGPSAPPVGPASRRAGHGRATAAPNPVASLRERTWSAALAAGDFQWILEQARGRGVARSLAEAHSEDLAALADAARYLRRDELARQALIAQRDRFPRTDRAHEAAFLLGRLGETGSNNDPRALFWYDRYLSEAPSGAYASEALGRKMTATEKLKGGAAARDIAREYLHRFPHGTYAGAARVLSETTR